MDKNNRPHRLTIFLSDSEKDALDRWSRMVGLQPGDLLRQTIRAQDPDEERRRSWLNAAPSSNALSVAEEDPA